MLLKEATPSDVSVDSNNGLSWQLIHVLTDHMMQSIKYSYEGRLPKKIIVDQQRQLFNNTEVKVEKRKRFKEAVQ